MAVQCFNLLPDEKISEIFNFLGPRELLRCAQVDKRFRAIAVEICNKLGILKLSDLKESDTIKTPDRAATKNKLESFFGEIGLLK